MGQSVPSTDIQTPGNVFVDSPSKQSFTDIYTVTVLDGDINGSKFKRWCYTSFNYQLQVRYSGHHLQVRYSGHHLPTMFSVRLLRDTSEDLGHLPRPVTT